ncbi:CarD family transcriptional regulator [Clostridium sp. UBA4548]|uniref:CarD family transcriptional regulator n=1 Tax=Clostridium sp. UBA4548 TaxID=1946361 RepID=UPI0025C2A191|nr:CarD family transcriptional regulator [Clostridium sp. UBA4548]
MFNVGDFIIYAGHGICHIDDICENAYLGVTRKYYVLHPLENCELIISTPVDNDKVTMLNLMDPKEAEEILESFREPGINWVELSNQRDQIYSEIVKSGNRKEISKVVNTLIRKKLKTEAKGKKLYEQDRRLLDFVQHILFAELAVSLNTTHEEVYEKVMSIMAVN